MIAERFTRHLARGQLIIGLGMATLLTGQTIVPESQQLAPDPPLTQPESYGSSVAIDTVSGIAVVGASGGTGSAYIFRRDVSGIWLHDDQFLGIGTGGSENFGSACAVSGEVIAIGVPRRALGLSMPGAVDMYRWNGALWSQEPTLMPYTGGDTEFGRVVVMEGDLLVVGAPDANLSPLPGHGAVQVYRDLGLAGWVVEAVLTGSAPYPGSSTSGFGTAIDTDGEILAVGDPSQTSASGVGVVHLYRLIAGTWVLDTVLIAVGTPRLFGQSVAVRGDVLVVGDPRINSFIGEVVIFHYDGATWQEETIVSGNIPGSGFGNRVAIEENRVLISQSVSPVQVVHVYQDTGGAWSETETLVPSSTSPMSLFGNSLAVSGGSVMVGAGREETNPGVETGAAYLFGGFI